MRKFPRMRSAFELTKLGFVYNLLMYDISKRLGRDKSTASYSTQTQYTLVIIVSVIIYTGVMY